MVDGNDGKLSDEKAKKPSRLSRFEGIIISRERFFDVLSTIITAIFTIVLVRWSSEMETNGILPKRK
jgi:hypothetical protein